MFKIYNVQVKGISCTMYCHFLDDVVNYRTSEATLIDIMLLKKIKGTVNYCLCESGETVTSHQC